MKLPFAAMLLLLSSCSTPAQSTQSLSSPAQEAQQPEARESSPPPVTEAITEAEQPDAVDGSLDEPSQDADWSSSPIEIDELPPPLRPHKVKHRDLRAVKSALARSIGALKRAAPGIRPVPELDGRRLGRTYTTLEAELDDGSHVEALTKLVYAHLRPALGDFVFYARVSLAQKRSAAEIRETFDVGSKLQPTEATALDNLAKELEAQLGAHPLLRAYGVKGGWGDAVGSALHGVAIVSPDDDEVFWVHTKYVWCEC